jgi:hypothetical protein
MKAILTLIIISVFLAYSPETIAQKKPTQPKWTSIQTYDSISMENQKGDVVIKDVNPFLKGACTQDDPVQMKEFLEQAHGLSSSVEVNLEDGPSDSSGKILSATLTATHRSNIYVSGITIPYTKKITEIKFYRDRNECIKEREVFKQWLVEKNKEYRSSIGKYN